MCVCVFFVCLCILLHANHCVLAFSRLLKFKTWLLLLFCLFNTYYLLSNENPLFVILSLVACLTLLFCRIPYFIILFFYFIVHSFSLSVLSLFDIFDALSVHFFHIHLFHFVCYYMCSLAFKIVHHRLKLLTKIQSNINNRNFPVFAVIIYFCSSYTLDYYSFLC